MKRSPTRHVSCLLCGNSYNRLGWSAHLRAANHQNRGEDWWKYNSVMRRMMRMYIAQSLELLKHSFTFPNSMEPRIGKTLQWFRYAK